MRACAFGGRARCRIKPSFGFLPSRLKQAVQQRWPSGLRQLAEIQPYSKGYQGFESPSLRQRALICGCAASMSEGLLGFRVL